eukprot:8079287-Ditylum_brightwellii.AAC.1
MAMEVTEKVGGINDMVTVMKGQGIAWSYEKIKQSQVTSFVHTGCNSSQKYLQAYFDVISILFLPRGHFANNEL